MQRFHDTLEALQLGGMTVYPLLCLGIIALAIILDKFYLYWRYVRLPARLADVVETYSFDWRELEGEISAMLPRNYYGRFLHVILNNRGNPAWWVESRASDESQSLEKSLNRGLWILETVVTAAPLLGLVGTIVGMMASFRLIGDNGLVNPTGITAGVAQALIATTLGLIIAIMALFAFNFFSHVQSQTIDQMERLGTRLLDHIRMDQEKRGGERTDETA